MHLNWILCLPSGEEGEKPEGETAAEGGETAEKEEGEEGSKSPVPQVEFYSNLSCFSALEKVFLLSRNMYKCLER